MGNSNRDRGRRQAKDDACRTAGAGNTNDSALRLLSNLDPIRFTDGWDGGMLIPGRVYRRQFATPGTYSYTDGNGHVGQVIVLPHRTYLPLVLRDQN